MQVSTSLKVLVPLGLVYVSFFFNIPWLFGVVILAWISPDIRSGTTHFFEVLTRRRNPWLYWSVVVTWVFFGLYLIYESIATKI